MLLLERPEGRTEVSVPLTLEGYLSLPEDTRCEIVDGVVRPLVRPDRRSRAVRGQLVQRLWDQQPPELAAIHEEVVVLGVDPPHARIPDVVVFRAGADPTGETNHTAAADVLLAVEVVSHGSQTADRYEKPGEYARNGVPSFWRIELEPAIAVHVYRLVDGVYRDEGVYTRGGLIKDPTLEWVSIEVDDLLGDYA